MVELAGMTEATHCLYCNFTDLLELGRRSQAMVELAGRTEATHCLHYNLTFVDLLELGRRSQAMVELAGRTEATHCLYCNFYRFIRVGSEFAGDGRISRLDGSHTLSIL